MNNKRLTLVCGHYGSGKTNIAVNLAFDLKKRCEKVAIADLDIVNPYFRTKDSEQELEAAGIRVICSQYANTNLDIPALPQDIYSIVDEKDMTVVLDIGGDDRGAMVLGRISPMILEEDNYEMIYVVNKFRPLTADVKSALEIMREIEQACRIRFTAVVNNSNLGEETTCEHVLSSMSYAQQIADEAGIELKFTSVSENLYKELENKVHNLYPLRLQKKLIKECI